MAGEYVPGYRFPLKACPNDDESLGAPANAVPDASMGISATSATKRLRALYAPRCKKCGAFVGNGGWILFGDCKRCGEHWG